jgi:hypothetical protein
MTGVLVIINTIETIVFAAFASWYIAREFYRRS